MADKSAEWKQSTERLRVLEQEKADLNRSLYGQLDLKVKLTEYENRVAILLQEIERLNGRCRAFEEQLELAQKNSKISEGKVLQSMGGLT